MTVQLGVFLVEPDSQQLNSKTAVKWKKGSRKERAPSDTTILDPSAWWIILQVHTSIWHAMPL